MHLVKGECGCCLHESVCFGQRLGDHQVFFVCPACCAAGFDPPEAEGLVPLSLETKVWQLAPEGWGLAEDEAVLASPLSAFLGAPLPVAYRTHFDSRMRFVE
jgi:hypothetical protein